MYFLRYKKTSLNIIGGRSMLECKQCGKNNPDMAEYCQECGTQLQKSEDKKEDKKFGEFTGNTIIDTIIWIVIVLIVGGLFANYVLGPIFLLFI